MSRSWNSRRQTKTLQEPLHPSQSAKRITAAIVMTPVEKTSLAGATTHLVMTGENATIVPQLPKAIMIAETVGPMTVVATAVMPSTGKTTVDSTGVAMTLVTGAVMTHAVVPVVVIDVCNLVLVQLLLASILAGPRIITSTVVKVDAED